MDSCKQRVEEAIADGTIRDIERPGMGALRGCHFALETERHYQETKKKITEEAVAAGRYPIRPSDTVLRQR